MTWIVQRVCDTANPVDAWISTLAAYGLWLAGGLFLLALAVSALNRQSFKPT